MALLWARRAPNRPKRLFLAGAVSLYVGLGPELVRPNRTPLTHPHTPRHASEIPPAGRATNVNITGLAQVLGQCNRRPLLGISSQNVAPSGKIRAYPAIFLFRARRFDRISHNRGTEYFGESGMKWMRASAKRRCNRGIPREQVRGMLSGALMLVIKEQCLTASSRALTLLLRRGATA